MELVLIMLTVQALMGAFDNLYHHEITEKLPSKPSARGELTLHTVREYLYAVIFLALGWYQLQGVWAWALMGLMAIEIIVTLWDFVIEDQTRKLPKFERILHTVLAINFGVILAFLGPILWQWAQLPTAMILMDYGIWSLIMTLFAVGVFLWAVRDMIAVIQLSRKILPDWQRHPIKRGHNPQPKKILLSGATGFIGRHLVRRLIEQGEEPIIWARDMEKARNLFGPHVKVINGLEQIHDEDQFAAIINLAGAPVIGMPWTKARRKILMNSRVGTTEKLAALIQRLERKPAVLISGSAIGFYGNRGDEELTEAGGSQDIFMAQLCRRWEEAANLARNFGVRVCLLRTGLVLGHDGGALPQLMRPATFGMGVIFGRGRHWQSWIHIKDLVRMICFALEQEDLKGPLNATAPYPVRQKEFAKAMGRVLFRPIWMRVPPQLLKWGLGEMADIFVEGQKVLPEKAQQAGFEFYFPRLDGALLDLKHQAGQRITANRDPLAIYFNQACSICRTEVTHYKKIADREALPMRFSDINQNPHALEKYGLQAMDIRRRFYVMDGEGQVYGGMDAFIRLWMRTPGFRWLGRLAQWPMINGLAHILYEDVTVPWLWRRNQPKDPGNCTICQE